ncbi:uncharacterized protein ACIQIH_017394 [Cyanocitta cristata]
MALAGGGAAAAADAGLRLAARPPALPPSAAAAPSGPPPPPRAPPASQPGGDSPTPPTPIPPRGHGPSAHGAYALPQPDGLSGSAPAAASACSSSFSLAASAQLLTRSPPASPSTQRLPAQPLRPARSPRLSPAPPSPGSVSLLLPPAPRRSTEGPLGGHFEAGRTLREREGRTAGGPALPASKMSAGLSAPGEAVAPPPARAGAMLGAAPLRARLAGPAAGRGRCAPCGCPPMQVAWGEAGGRAASGWASGWAGRARPSSRPRPWGASGCGTAALGSLLPPRSPDWVLKYPLMNEDSLKNKQTHKPTHNQTV